MSGADAYAVLVDAMDVQRPLCRGDDRFTANSVTPADRIEMCEMCTLCPIRAACAAYAEAEQPRAGFWAGQFYKDWETA
jgi:hypothetical protein